MTIACVSHIDHYIRIIGIVASCFCACSCQTARKDLRDLKPLSGVKLPLARIREGLRDGQSFPKGRVTGIFLLECAECSALGAFPFTAADESLPKPVLILHKNDDKVKEALTAINSWVLDDYIDQFPQEIGGLPSFAAILDEEGVVIKARDLTRFANVAEVQKWASLTKE